jgi:hypothetical protein
MPSDETRLNWPCDWVASRHLEAGIILLLEHIDAPYRFVCVLWLSPALAGRSERRVLCDMRVGAGRPSSRIAVSNLFAAPHALSTETQSFSDRCDVQQTVGRCQAGMGAAERAGHWTRAQEPAARAAPTRQLPSRILAQRGRAHPPTVCTFACVPLVPMRYRPRADAALRPRLTTCRDGPWTRRATRLFTRRFSSPRSG